jgi:hypothetical protein
MIHVSLAGGKMPTTADGIEFKDFSDRLSAHMIEI